MHEPLPQANGRLPAPRPTRTSPSQNHASVAVVSRRRVKAASADAISKTVALFAALANPLRLRLLVALTEQGELSAGQLQDAVGAEQSAVSHQLAALKRARLVAATRDGRRMMYAISDHHVAHIVGDAMKHAAEAS